ncbi:unnamed protein product [Urochloa humidicola]
MCKCRATAATTQEKHREAELELESFKPKGKACASCQCCRLPSHAAELHVHRSSTCGSRPKEQRQKYRTEEPGLQLRFKNTLPNQLRFTQDLDYTHTEPW